jgi:Zn-dependent peptidase ImmA (M78 family)
MTDGRPRPLKEAGNITLMLDQVLGVDRFERGPVDVVELALQYSAQTARESPIVEVEDRDLPGCTGALLYSDDVPRNWGIYCNLDQSPGRRRFTVAHEFGHYVLHRRMIEDDGAFAGGIYCDEDSVHQGGGQGIEREADSFAANLLMPLNDFRRVLPARTRPDFDQLGALANRYGVSITAAILRWLEYTETRALVVVSNEGFALWSKPSGPALKSGAFIKTKNTMYELPERSAAVMGEHTDETRSGVAQPAGTWFREPLVEMCLKDGRRDQEITLLHLEGMGPKHQSEEMQEDTFDRLERRP